MIFKNPVEVITKKLVHHAHNKYALKLVKYPTASTHVRPLNSKMNCDPLQLKEISFVRGQMQVMVDSRKVSKRQQYTEEWYATRTLIT